MTVLITCGYQEAWCNFAQSRLLHMGVETPISSSRTNLSPNELTAKMHKVLKLHRKPDSEVTQVSPGKAWQIAAADMFVGNADIETWGWADPKNIHFLEFWRDFDPMCNFLLIYGSPAQSFTCQLDALSSLPDNIADEMEGWIKYHEALLRFYHQHPDRCLLVHISKFEKTARELTQTLDRQFDITARQINSSHLMEESPLLRLIAQNILRNRQEDESLYLELEGSADIAADMLDETDDLIRLTHEVLEQSRDNESDVAQLEKHGADLELALEVAVGERDTSISDLHTLTQTVTSEQAQRAQLQKELHEQSELTNRAAFSVNENELLSMQLQQVQEELELYFKKYQELKVHADSEKVARKARPASTLVEQGAFKNEPSVASEATVDMRMFINGTGWHGAETNGRWAGPGLTSTVTFPTLSSGAYRVEIDIVDAMSFEIVKNMKLSFNGQPLKSHLKVLSNVGGRLAPLRRLKAVIQNVEKPYPARVFAQIPYDVVEESKVDNILTISCPEALSPSGSGQSDYRSLSVCVKSVLLAKVL